MYLEDGHQLYMPQDVRLCSVCRNWVELSEFRRRSGGGIASECRECHNQARAAQARRQRARRRRQGLQDALSAVNESRRPSELVGAARAVLGVCGGLRGFAERYVEQFNAAKPGSQMRTTMLLAGMRLIVEAAKHQDGSTQLVSDMTDQQLVELLESLAPSTEIDPRHYR